MSASIKVSQLSPEANINGPRLAGVWRILLISAWSVVFALSLLCAVLSIASLNIWDRVPAGEAYAYFPSLDPDFVASKTAFQKEVIDTGISLAAFANVLTAFRIIGGLALFILSALLIRRYSRSLMAVLFGILLAVMGAAGVWQSPLFSWSTLLADWMVIPAQILNLLLWMGLVFLYAFPDGRFTPRWTVGLVVLLIPIVIAQVFDLPVFFNPAAWPDLLALLPNLVFIGAALFSMLYRYRKEESGQKTRLSGLVFGIALLLCLYFILYFINTVYPVLTGQDVFTTGRDIVLFILISEPLWYLGELFFMMKTAQSLFTKRLFE
jgi:hypothetical protein